MSVRDENKMTSASNLRSDRGRLVRTDYDYEDDYEHEHDRNKNSGPAPYLIGGKPLRRRGLTEAAPPTGSYRLWVQQFTQA
jgi:hypothetical protein